jgi:hypothetical protein
MERRGKRGGEVEYNPYMWVPHVIGNRVGEGIANSRTRGQFGLFTFVCHAVSRTWSASSAKVAKM